MLKFRKFSQFARDLADLSTCKRDRVGCIVFPPTFSAVASIGYNGPAHGQSNDACRNEAGNCGCAHAEANAVSKLKTSAHGLIMFCTRAPCETCASLIANCQQISVVIWDQPYRNALGLDVLSRADIETWQTLSWENSLISVPKQRV